jgi:Uma2 family endonuclease
MASTAGTTRPFVYLDLEAIPDDGYRREIIDGVLTVTPAPVTRHQDVTLALYRLLYAGAQPDLKVLVAPYDWLLPDGGSVQPDVIVFRRNECDLDGPLPATATPLLVVEVLSPSGIEHDRILKRAIYQRLGVPAYWIVDPGSKISPPLLTVLRLQDGIYIVEADIAGPQQFITDWPYPVQVVPGNLPD